MIRQADGPSGGETVSPGTKSEMSISRNLRQAFLSLAALVGLAAGSPSANAGLIAAWNFNNSTASTNSLANTANLFTATGGTMAATATMSTTFNPTSITAFTGSGTNLQPGDSIGNGLALQGGPNGGGSTAPNNGQSLTFGASTVGQTAIVVSFASQRTTTGFNNDQFQYSLDGVTFINFNAAYNPVTSYTAPAGLQTFDLSGITGLANDANAAFRIIFNGATSGAGNNRIDNLTISGTTPNAVPEPASLAMVGLGLTAAMLVAHRRRGSV